MGLPFRYNLRNVARRKLRTALTALGIGLVIAIAVIMLAYGRGLLYAVRNNGDADNVIVLSRRATDRTFSSLKKADLDRLAAVVSDRVVELDGWLDLVAGYVQHAALVRIEGVEGGRYGARKLGMIQGVDPVRAGLIHRRFEVLDGRPLEEGDERVCIVGALTHARLGVEPADVAVGKTLHFAGAEWSVVGRFDVEGTSAAGEIWVPRKQLMTVLDRPDLSYAVLKAKSAADVEPLLQQINRSDQIELRAVSEVAFYRGFAETFRTFALIGGIMALVITIGGIVVGMNTMYTAVTGRVREIGMLQVIGFSKRSILWSFMLESLLVAVAGGVIGCALGTLAHGVPMKVTMGVFLFRVDGIVLAIGFGLAIVIGVVGALVPALRAIRMRKVDAMRYA